MPIIYHGTSVSKGICIARGGEILSKLRQVELEMQKYKMEKPENFEESFPCKSVEEVALQQIYGIYEPRDISTVRCVAMTKDFDIAKGHAMTQEWKDGGMVLGVYFEDGVLEDMCDQNHSNSVNLFIPKHVSIKTLEEIHLSPTAKKHEELIKEEFGRYYNFYFDMK